MSDPGPLHFSKMHGAGNDFVLVDCRQGRVIDAAIVRAMADRHRGIGCDQFITIEPAHSAGAVAGYRIWNTDGSSAQQCGNGARCVAAWLRREHAELPPHFVLDSPAGAVAVETLGGGNYALQLGRPEFRPERIPLRVDAEALTYTLNVAGEAVHFAAASMGNPHALIEMSELDDASVQRLGPALQARPEFPDGVNVGFARVRSRSAIDLRVYERGVGETLACGSGACAAVAILVRAGRVGRSVRVSLPGGDLEIAWPDDGAPVRMAGPTAFVFDGDFEGVW
ncbi:MAG: diaminopimelate epimerase [Gammaproteobacteria bacterium HGW-Gammaproteobacteria-5]|jgi:diaminopimelate epimerase|nr:MAG: diaminopimelate epimerase [Gammaproteobacteria bacterium HGW-Gammaproteobacteria-5]PKM16547.1 MAG: diaminopimelate epimerase [Gammaproteobacteria bacterium HGW-Gammaproteobacteria-2]